MRLSARTVLLGAVSMLAAAPAATAAGPVDWAVEILWWNHDYDVDLPGLHADIGADEFAYRGEVWILGRLGLSAARYESDPDGDTLDEAEYASADVTWRVLNPGPRKYLALGAGWEKVDAGDGDTEGVRAVASARLGFVYARGAWMPSLDEFDTGPLTADEVEGREWEVGISFDFAILHFLAGYRSTAFEFDVRGPGVSGNADTESSGWFAGIGVHF